MIEMKYEIWNDKTLDHFVEMYNKKELYLPKFQRGLSWSFDRQKKLIKTLQSGNPIGTFLFANYYDSSIKSGTKYQIIDGLQRLNAIITYKENPRLFFDNTMDIIDDDLIFDLMEYDWGKKGIKFEKENKSVIENFKTEKEEIYKIFEKNVFNSKGKITEELSAAIKFVNNITEKFGKNEIVDNIASQIHDEAIKKIQLKNILIPVIVYKGDDINELANVFVDLNRGGLQLSDYDIYAARWVNFNLELSHDLTKRILDNVKSKYEAISEEHDNDSTLELEYVINEENPLNLYDYFLALSFELSKSFSFYRSPTSKVKDIYIGFILFSLLLSGQENRIDIVEYLYNSNQDREELNNFLEKQYNLIVETVKKMDRYLQKFIQNGKKTLKAEYIQPYALYHLFSSIYFNENTVLYDTEDGIKSYLSDSDKGKKIIPRVITNEKKLKMDNFEENYKIRMFYNLVSNFWTKNRQVSDLNKLIQNKEDRQMYWSSVRKEDFDGELSNWINSQVYSNLPKYIGSSFSPDVKLATIMLHNKSLESNKIYHDEYIKVEKKLEYDHLVPKDKLLHLNKIVADQKTMLPISAAINCWLLPEKINKIKSNKHLGESDLFNRHPFTKKFNDFLKLDTPKDSILKLSDNDQILEFQNYFKNRADSYRLFILNLWFK